MSAQDVWDGTVATEFAGGTGTESDPYLIETGAQLAYLAQQTNQGYSGYYYKLIADIELNSDVLTADFELNGTPANTWTPIGISNYFSGYFDGGNHIVSGVYVPESMNLQFAGLFGRTTTAEIHHLAVVDTYVAATWGAGAIVGNVGYERTHKTTVHHCYAEARSCAIGNYNFLGAVVGHIDYYSIVQYCYASGYVTGTYNFGGIAGHSDRGNVLNSFSTCKIGTGGKYVGGCIGQSYDATATNLYFDKTKAPDIPVLGYGSGSNCEGKTTEEMFSQEFADLLGEPFVYDGNNYPYIEGLPQVGEKSTILNSGNRIYVGHLTNAEGSTFRFFGEYTDNTLKKAIRGAEAGATVYIQPKYAKFMTLVKGSVNIVDDTTGATLTVSDLGNDVYSFTMPDATVTVTAKFIRDGKVLNTWDGTVANTFAGGSGTRRDPYLIETASQLAYLAQITNNNGNDTNGKFYRLTANILLNANVLTSDYELNDSNAIVWTPIGNSYRSGFQGEFDGGGHVISGLYFAGNDDVQYVGLFGTLTSSAFVHDLSVVDAYINSPKTAGILAGGLYYSPTIQRCYTDGYVTGTAGYSALLAGCTGENASATIEYCYVKGKACNDNSSAGLLAHYHGGSISKNFVVGNFSGGSGNTGTFFGYVLGGQKNTQLYYDKTVEPNVKAFDQKDYTTCYGMTTEEMKSQAFADLLGDPFVYTEGNYPYVKGLLPIGEKVSFVESGYRVNVGTLKDNRGSTLLFSTDYENGIAKENVSFVDEGKTVYVIVSLNDRILYEDGSLVVTDDMTGENITLTPVADNVFKFTMPGSPVTASAAFYYDPAAPAEWDGTAANSFADGTGTADDPYIISSGEELAYLAQMTNANGELTKGKYYSIVRDIELNTEVLTNSYGLNNLNGRTFNAWTTIGNSTTNSFQGILEGNNHVISGLYLYGDKQTGLFGYLKNAIIRNLSVIDAYNYGQNIALLTYQADSTTISRIFVEGCAQNSGDYSGYNAALLVNQLGPKSKVEYCYTKGYIGKGWYNRSGGAGLVYVQDENAEIHNCFSASSDFRAVYNAQNTENISHVYSDNDLGDDFTTHETFCGKHTIEMHTTDFATLMGAPFEYVLGNYPYIPGLMKIGENRGWETPENPTYGGAGRIWEGETSVVFASGTGTEDDPYIINNGEQLSYLAKLTNANGNLTKGRYYQLGADIILNDSVLYDNYSVKITNGNAFTAIGSTKENSFQGVFNGNNHTIYGLYIPSGRYIGLFGYANNSTIGNFSMVDSYVCGQNIALLAYQADSTTISRIFVEGCAQNSGDYSGYNAALLVNQLGPKSKVEYCYTKGYIGKGWYNRSGGAGLVYVQDENAEIHNCFSVSSDFKAVYNAQNTEKVNNVYSDNDLADDFTTHETFCGKHTIEMHTTDFATLMGAPFEYVLGNYPYIPGLMKIGENRGWMEPSDPTHGGAGGVWDGEASITFASGTGSEDDPYIINNGAQLYYLAKLTNANGNLTKGRYYRLEADIVLNDSLLTTNFALDRTKTRHYWEAIGDTKENKFQGVFDGNLYSISGFILDGSGNQGFFGYVDNAVIKNLIMLDSYVRSTYSGMLAYQADSTEIKYCFVEGLAQNINSNTSCSATMFVNQLGPKSLMEYCYASGAVDASAYNLKGSLAIALDDSSTVRNCYAAVRGVPAFYNARGTVSNVYFDSNLAGSTLDTRDDYRSAATVEMLSLEFAERMGAPYEYELDYYPQIYGLPKIYKDGYAEVVSGYSLRLGTLTNADKSTIKFYRTYVSKTGTLKNSVVSGGKVYVKGETKIYVKVNSTDTRRLSDEGLIVKTDQTNEIIEVTKIADDLYMFLMPANTVTVSASFVLGGYCGNPSVNNGRDVKWDVLGDQSQLVISGLGEMVKVSWNAFAGTVQTIEVSEGVTNIPSQAFKGMNKVTAVTLPATVETIGAEAFSGCSATVDLRPCTQLTALHTNEFAQFTGTVYLPATVTTIEAGAFAGTYASVKHIYSPVLDGLTLYANDKQVHDTNGLGDVKDFGVTQNEAVALVWYIGYNVNIGTVAGTSCALKVYADEALTTEIPNGYKAIRKDDATKVYVKAQPRTTSILFKNGLTVKAESSTLTVTQEGDELFSFLMPKAPVTISASFSTGGYCGASTVNNGRNLIWTLNNGTLAFQKNGFAKGDDLTMGGNAPWSTLGSSVTKIDLSGVTNIGSNAFNSCTIVTGIELPAIPVLTVGTNAFAEQMWIIVPAQSWSSYLDASGWTAYESQMAKDKESLALVAGQQWRTYYSKVGRLLPIGIKAYTVSTIGNDEVMTGEALDYVPANQAVLIQNGQKTARTIDAITSLQLHNNTPVCLLSTNEDNLLQWITEPMAVKVGQGYTLYKDEFVKVSTGTLPAGIAFLPAQGATDSRLSIFCDDDELTGIDGVQTVADQGEWYTIDGKKLYRRPAGKGLYVKDGQKVVIR